MSETFNIDYEWLPSEDGSAAERATLAALVINVGEDCATQVEDISAKSVRPSARLSALRLAEWFAHNWWRLLWEPKEPKTDSYSWRASHKVGNAGDGYVWPDLSFSSDWQRVEVVSTPTPRLGAEPVRYLNRFETYIFVEDFERGIEDFIEGVIDRLANVPGEQSDLSALWHEVTRERYDSDASQWRSLEACMGYDPDEAPDGLIDSLLSQMDSYGASAVREMASASGAQTVSRINGLCDAASGSDGVSVQIPDYDNIRHRLQVETHLSDIPWQRAERAAHISREVWGLEVPISNERLLDIFHISKKRFSDVSANSRTSLTAGFRDRDAPNSFRFSWNSRRETSRRFVLARLASDHITALESEDLLPATRSITSRQKFQRAFAQEFLCPFSVLMEKLGNQPPDADNVHAVADYFDVSPLMVQTTLVNKRILDPKTLADWAV